MPPPGAADPPGTGLRCRPAAETWARAQPLLQPLGISRVTDITRMDWLGVPVCASIRPRGRTLRVHAGKGLRLNDARVGALMEAVEFALSEQLTDAPPDAHPCVGDVMAQFGGTLRWLDFAPRLGIAVEARDSIATLRCDDLADGVERQLPAELFTLQAEGTACGHFGSTTNGLASGNSLVEATLHAVCEVLERDAIALNRARDDSARLDEDALPPPFGDWSQAWRTRGVELIVRVLPNDFDLPCFEAHLHEARSPDVNLMAGSGLHPDPQIALARAVTEAAQSRLTFIHGGRDDIVHYYAKFADGRRDEAAYVRALCDRSRSVAFGDVAAADATDLPSLLAHLRSRGFPTVLRRRLDTADGLLQQHGLHVVKVVVPRCETIHGVGNRMGTRLLARVIGRRG